MSDSTTVMRLGISPIGGSERENAQRNFASARAKLRRYVENDLMKREPHPDAKPLGAFSIGRRAE